MLQFIYILQLHPTYRKPENRTAETNEIIGKHFNYLKELHKKGIVDLAGRPDYEIDSPENFGICFFNAENYKQATALMNDDPCMLNDVMYAELHPFKIYLH